ncbi:MAG: tetratricopeptide repeat protein [Phycisphaerae bacterium]
MSRTGVNLGDLQTCPNCRISGAVKRIDAALRRCAACEFVYPILEPHTVDIPTMPVLRLAAPQGVLRERYQLRHALGHGAHGVTFFAEHRYLNHPCVVKLMPWRSGLAEDSAVRRLRNEARAGFQVNDPCVVRVLDCDVINGVWFFVMEYVEGGDLATLVEGGVRVPWQQAVAIAADAARGLAAIHERQHIHRDIKPSNLLLGVDGRTRVADLGVAAIIGGAGGDESNERAGTLAYACPESWEVGVHLDARADLYSLGASLFHLMTGRHPYESSGVLGALLQMQSARPDWPEDAPPTPGWLRDGVLKLLSNNRDARFSSAREFLQFLEHPGQSATPAPAAAAHATPRGVAILPFENDGDAADDWLGQAISDHAARGAAQCPGVFVVNAQQILELLEPGAHDLDPLRVTEAGRLTGAALVVSGRVKRVGDQIEAHVVAHRVGADDPFPLAILVQPLSRFVDLQARVVETILNELRGPEVHAASGASPPAISLQAQERLVKAKRAFLRGEYETAADYAEQAVTIAPDFVEPISVLGVCYARLGRYEDATARHVQLRETGVRLGNSHMQVEAEANLGVMHYFKGEYDTADHHYQRAAELAEQHGLKPDLAQIYNNLGFILYRLGRPDAAESAFLRSIELHREFGALVSLVGPYNGLGNVLLEQQRYDESTQYYRRALALAVEIGDPTKIGVSHMHLGRCAALAGRFADAKTEFALACNELEETSFWNGLARVYEYMAEMNFQLADYAEAARCAERRLELAIRHANRSIEESARRQRDEALRLAAAAQPGNEPKKAGAPRPAGATA